MLDLGSRWSLPQEYGVVDVAGGRLKITRVRHWHQALVSGNEVAAREALDLGQDSVGAFGLATGSLYGVTVARDRFLAVSQTPFGVAEGWHDSGFAFTRMSDAYAVIDISGRDLEVLTAQAANPCLVAGSRSARVSFAGRGCLTYHYQTQDILRVHIDRSHIGYVLAWIANARAGDSSPL